PVHTTTCSLSSLPLFFSNDSAPPHLYTLSLHDALPISLAVRVDVYAEELRLRAGQRLVPAPEEARHEPLRRGGRGAVREDIGERDRKSTRLNSSHQIISYAVFCLKRTKLRKRWRI